MTCRFQIFSDAIKSDSEASKLLDPRKDVVVSFMELIHDMPEEIVLKVFENVSKTAVLRVIADSVLRYPPEFHIIFTLMFPPLLASSREATLYESILYFLKRLGNALSKSELGERLFLDVFLNEVLHMAVENPSKRDSVAELVYSYIADTPTAHMSMLRHLNQGLATASSGSVATGTLDVYIHILSFLAAIEGQLGLLCVGLGCGEQNSRDCCSVGTRDEFHYRADVVVLWPQ